MTENQSADNQYETLFNNLMGHEVYGLERQQKQQLLIAFMNLLHGDSVQYCTEYHNLFNNIDGVSSQISEVPYIAIRLFKYLTLSNVPEDAIFKILASSGTTSQTPAKVVLDKATSSRQSKVLVKILQSFLGKQRLPMLIIDAPSTVKGGGSLNARAAGIQGLSLFGRNHTYALNDDMSLNTAAVMEFQDRFANQPVLIFGFTFMVWRYFVGAVCNSGISLNFPEGILLHSGGWKKLESEKVDNKTFKEKVRQKLGISRVHNFYGMAEQVGSIFMECEQGHLHAPIFSDVIARDPYDLSVSPVGKKGLIQVLSVVPTSYPGHSILTEDLGTIHGVDNCSCGRKGTYFSIEGRLPKTEVRGCSDTHQ